MIMKRIALATLAAGICINLSEFVRNEILLKGYWLAKYDALGIEFPSAPVNGALWGLWGFVFAGCIVTVRRRATFTGTIALCWTLGFALMWIVIGNLNVLPVGLLPIAVPWSLAEVVLAVFVAQRIMKKPEPNTASKSGWTCRKASSPS
jgi:hypothetical protein